MGGRLSLEYLDISLQNIYYCASEQQKYFISNFGFQKQAQFITRLNCPTDKFYSQKKKSIDNQMTYYIPAYIFQVGMIALYGLTLQNPEDLYLKTGNINNDLLMKRIESLSSKVSLELLAFLKLCLQTKESSRLDLDQLMVGNYGKNIVKRKQKYFQGKLQETELYSGFIIEQDQEQLPHGIGDIITEQKQFFKGMFQNGDLNGYGIWHDGEKKFAFGYWKPDSIQEYGILIIKGQYIFFGPISDFQPSGVGVMICLAENKASNFLYFEGLFDENGDPIKGETVYKNFKKKQEPPFKFQSASSKDQAQITQYSQNKSRVNTEQQENTNIKKSSVDITKKNQNTSQVAANKQEQVNNNVENSNINNTNDDQQDNQNEDSNVEQFKEAFTNALVQDATNDNDNNKNDTGNNDHEDNQE